MWIHRLGFIVVALSLWTAIPAYAIPRYKITALSKLPNAIESRVFDLNDRVQIVGDFRLDNSGNIGQARPVAWDVIGGASELSIPVELWNDPLIGGSAADINNHVVVVGRYGLGTDTPVPGPGVPFGRGFVWDSANGRRDLGLEPVGNSQAVAINDAGQVVGTSEVLMNIGGSNFFVPRAFIWDEANGIQDIGTLGDFYSFANDVNELGQVVGYAETTSGDEFAFLWDAGMGMREILSPTGTSSRAWGVNDDGVVVGAERNDFALLPPNAFIWTNEGGVRLLDFPDGTSSIAFAINSRQEVVGQFTSITAEQGAFIWTETFGVVDLETLIAPGSGWELAAALAINNRGDIVGFGKLNGETRGFFLTPIPEPRTAILAVLAFLAVVIIRPTH